MSEQSQSLFVMAEPSSWSWNHPCTDEHLRQISLLITDWPGMAPFLDLSSADQENIKAFAPQSIPAQKVQMLERWKQKFGTAATYRKLTESFLQCGRQDLVDVVTKQVTELTTAETESETALGEPLYIR